MHDAIAVGDQVFAADGGEVFGAVRSCPFALRIMIIDPARPL